MNLREQIDTNKLPQHIAVIMDGNGRWAKQHGEDRIFGHQNGVISVRETVEAAAELGISYLTLYAFSTENWNRPTAEVEALMELLVDTIAAETATLNKNNIRLQTIGNTDSLPENCKKSLKKAIADTAQNTRMTLVLALSYSSRWEIVEAAKNLVKSCTNGDLKLEDIDNTTFENLLCTKGMPDPALMIRTSGECRISNFLLYQLAYAELYFTETLWPDFRKDDLYKAILSFQKRERRFGLTSEQLNNNIA